MSRRSVFIILLAAAVQLVAGVQSDGLFEVYDGEWETCKRINSSSACYRTREVYCRTANEKKPAPWRYCTDRGMGRLATVEECECEQNCVVTKWSEWTSCDNGEVYTTKQRTVAAPKLRNGKPCPALHEKKRCEMNSATVAKLERNHTWKLGPWLECVPIVQDGKECGHGVRRRSVDCVDLRGRIVNQTLCLEEEAYMHVLPPQTTQLCEIPCPCKLTVWGWWSDCSPDCTLPSPRLVRQRTRGILQHPTLGERCEDLEQSEFCRGEAQCPVYSWDTSGWSKCTVQDDHALCGVGLKQRYVYCMEERSDGSLEHVSSEKCNSSQRPSSLSSCDVPCHQQCEVSEWGPWAQCRNDTCNTTYTHRNRSVIVEPSLSPACPHLAEFRKCPQLPCVQWNYQRWSICYPNANGECGWGLQSRVVQCTDLKGNVVDNDLCLALHPSPIGVQLCYKHCTRDECVISDWGEWSDCSETCDNVSGIQSRSRYLLVNGSALCVHDDSTFYHERECSMDIPCVPEVYFIEYSEWGECYLPTGVVVEGELCEGIQNRTATCFREEQTLTQSECPVSFKELEEQPCNIPCTSQCVMSDWSSYSECSESCDRTRTRRLLWYGENCPHIDSNGVEYDTIPCALPCDSGYSWVAAERWSSCHVFPTPLLQLSHGSALIPDPGVRCGQGYRNRSVVCQDANGELVQEGFCSAENKPPSLEACVVQCYRRCIITDWTDYSVCSSGSPMERSREIIPFRGSDDYFSDCPELDSVVQEDAETCPLHDFSHFQWLNSVGFGELHKCYLEPSETCGSGKAYKTYGCVDNRLPSDKRVAVSPEFCDQGVYGSFETVQGCTDPCTIDCEYSDEGWSPWSPCSVSCGGGYKTRTRTIKRVPEDEGRLCGHLNETTTCEMPACDYVEYTYTPLSVCQPLNESSRCGEGVRVSNPICLVNGVVQPDTSACSSLGPRGQRVLDCRVPCAGGCVVSEWSEWRWCPECRNSCYERTRRILRNQEGDEDCEIESTREVKSCSSVNRVTWLSHEWTDCIPLHAFRSERDHCGNGIQRRVVECTLWQSGDVTYDEKCANLPKPDVARGCFIPCPVDCEVSTFSGWTGCSECTSNLKATMSRERYVLVQPENGGRSRPHLIEEQSCPNIGCDEYFVETNSTALDCYSERSDQVCGKVSHTVLLCRKNRDFVPLDECVRANVSGQIVHNAALLTHQDVYCDLECAMSPECSYTEFGAWSECQYMCDWPASESNTTSQFWFRFRSRSLLSSWEGSGSLCHDGQQEVQPCSPDETTSNAVPLISRCIQFDWITSKWYRNNTREVECHDNGTRVEEYACVKAEEPVAMRNAEHEGLCDCLYPSKCDGKMTACFCETGFEKVSSFCLLIEGCLNVTQLEGTQQCLPGQACGDGGSCVCEDAGCIGSTSSLPPSPSETSNPTTLPTTNTVEEPTSETTSTKTNGKLLVHVVFLYFIFPLVVLCMYVHV